MMQRVSDQDVKAIFPTTINTQPFILVASSIVDTYLGTSQLSAEVLREIERYLAAHFACCADPRAYEISDGDTRVRLQRGQEGTGFASTQYGQVVLALDSTGILQGMGGGKRAVIAFH